MSRILIIEDDNNILQLERDYLEAAGFETEIATDGETGSQRAIGEHFDLVLLDIMLPELNGFQVCKKIRSLKDIPIILVSAKKDDFDKIIASGFVHSPRVYKARAECFLSMGDREKAIDDLERYVEITGDLKTKEMINELKSVGSSWGYSNSFKNGNNGKDSGYDSKYGALKTEYEECCDLLGVKITDSLETIRKRFKALALQYHPDKNRSEDAERKFIEIRKAYEYLKSHF